MTYGVTSEGFKAKRFTDILSEIGEDLKTELGIDIDANPDSVAKVIANILSLPIADSWENTQSLQSMFDVRKAEGKHLDDIVGYLSISRLSGSASRGSIYVTADKEISITPDSVFKDPDGNEYTNTQTILVDKSNFTDITFSLSEAATIGTSISVEVNGISSAESITSTNQLAIDLLIDNINNNTPSNLVVATRGITSETIQISNVDDTSLSTIVSSNSLVINSLTSFNTIIKDEEGSFSVEADRVTVPPAISGITSITNRYPFIVGRYEESDLDLRARHALSLATSGAGTVEAIRADLLNIVGVSNAIVLENDTSEVDVNGLVQKSFLCIVKGGVDQDIGEAIWKTKGAGIATNGTTPIVVTDSTGALKAVRFSRPAPVYIHIQVTYSKYDEEAHLFPVDGETKMLNQILSYGEGLSQGEDVIPQRFASQVFNNVGGLGMVDITIGSTVSPNDATPTLNSSILSVDPISEAAFDALRITFVEV